jgi:hypothetical protein
LTISLPFWTLFLKLNIFHSSSWILVRTTHRSRCMTNFKGNLHLFCFGVVFFSLKYSSKWIQRNNPVSFLLDDNLLSFSQIFRKCSLLSAAQQISGSKTILHQALFLDLTPSLPNIPVWWFVQRSEVNEIRSDIQPFKENGFSEVKSPNLPSFSPLCSPLSGASCHQ